MYTIVTAMSTVVEVSFVYSTDGPSRKPDIPVKQIYHIGASATGVETTLFPYTTGEINMSLGCYGCRATSDIGDDIMFMGIPLSQLPSLVEGLERLGKKAIPDSRAKIYLPPLV